MSISGEGIDINDGYMLHPNKITNPKHRLYGEEFSPPDSTGCTVTQGIEDFEQVRSDIESLGVSDWESVDYNIKEAD